MSRLLSLLCIAVLSLVLAGCNDSAWNQKVTVVVDTPQGEKIGSSIMHVEWSGGIPFFQGDMRGGGYKLTGEAPVVNLGGGRYLFALLRGMDRLAHEAITGGRGTMYEAGPKIRDKKSPVVLPPKLYPTLVTFSDINDPTTAQQVNPSDLEQVLGNGVRLKSVTLTITKEPMSKGQVASVLKWIDHLADYRKSQDNPFTSTLPSEIGSLRRK